MPHVVGPWRTVRNGTALNGWWDIMTGEPGCGRQVATVVGKLGHDSESEANARLVAAAPELLAALKEAAHDFAIMRMGARMEKWDAAIAKAEGRE